MESEKRPSARKRRRVTLACNPCRIRKSRCDGSRPHCSSCTDFGEQSKCIYQDSDSHSRRLEGSTTMRQRIEMLEKTLQQLSNKGQEDAAVKSNSGYQTDWTTSSSPLSRGREACEPPNGQTSRPDQADDTSSEPINEEAQSSVDGMGAISSSRTGDVTGCGYFGPTSNLTLIQQIAEAFSSMTGTLPKNPRQPQAQEGSRGQQDRMSTLTHASSNKRRTTTQQYDVFALPAEALAEEMLREYFSTTNLFVPCLHEAAFLQIYKQGRRQGPYRLRKTWLAILNLVFAITATSSSIGISPSQKQADIAETYYQRALALCNPPILQGTSHEIVQFLVLMETYLQGSQRSVQTWSFHGLTVEAALQAGLHSKQALEGLSFAEQEMRKRTWYCCIMNDRIFSVVFGRPPLISETYIKMDLPTSTNNLFPSKLNSPNVVALSILCFCAEIALCKIISCVVDQMFNQNFAHTDNIPNSEVFVRRTRICWELAKWQDQLPQALRIISNQELADSPEAPSKPERFRVYLTLRYLHLKVLLHRRVLEIFMLQTLATAPSVAEMELLQEQGIVALQTCLNACAEIIGIVNHIVEASQKGIILCNAWWLTSYYTFNASLVIFGILLAYTKSTFLNNLQVADCAQYIEKGIDVLRKMDRGNLTIRTCRVHLERLHSAYLRVSPRGTDLFSQLPQFDDVSLKPFEVRSNEYQQKEHDVTESRLSNWPMDQLDDSLKETMFGMDLAELPASSVGIYGRGFFADRDVNGLDLGVPSWLDLCSESQT